MAALEKTKGRNLKQGTATVTQYVTFSIGEELFGIDVVKAQEVLNLSSVTKVPNTMPFMKGVIDLRGKIVPLIDMILLALSFSVSCESISKLYWRTISL